MSTAARELESVVLENAIESIEAELRSVESAMGAMREDVKRLRRVLEKSRSRETVTPKGEVEQAPQPIRRMLATKPARRSAPGCIQGYPTEEEEEEETELAKRKAEESAEAVPAKRKVVQATVPLRMLITKPARRSAPGCPQGYRSEEDDGKNGSP
jgi:hypothetical protein